jgi:exonuclease VII large subunit
MQRVDELSASLQRTVVATAARALDRVRALEDRLRPLHPRAVLARGYCICRRGEEPVRSAASLALGETVRLQFAEDAALVEVTGKEGRDERSA